MRAKPWRRISERRQASLRNLTAMEFVLYSLNGALLVSVAGLALWLWSVNDVTMGAITVTMTLAIRIIAMSGWILFTVAGIFDNIGVVQEGMQTISRDYDIKDRPDAKPLAVPQGRDPFRRRPLPLRQGRRASSRTIIAHTSSRARR